MQAHPTLVRLLLTLSRPILRIHLWIYIHNMRSSVFPGDLPARTIPGPDPERILFVGDIAVAGYGVLLEGMALPAQTAKRVNQTTGRGVTWENVGAYDLTAQKAPAALTGHLDGIDVAVIALGIPDVLLVTDQEQWRHDIAIIIDTVHDGAGRHCRIILAGLPPMHRFQPIQPVAQTVIQAQVRRLNTATADAAAGEDNVTFVPFPDLQLNRMYMKAVFSFSAMHQVWAEALAAQLAPTLSDPEPHHLAA